MAVWALGINHNTAPLDLRGRFAFALDQIAPTLQGLRQALGQSDAHRGVESAIISTCNRTEIYCAGNHAALDHTLDWLAHSGGVSSEVLRSHSYMLENGPVARHAFRVASGLDSMVLGEPQILGQMKDAVRAAEGAGALGSTLNQLFQRSFAVAKEVRTSLATAKLRWKSWLSVLPRAPALSAARTASFIWPRICASPSTMNRARWRRERRGARRGRFRARRSASAARRG